ncbi:hypothetical protein J3U21_06195 [Gilliamella sp. B2776]|uniref:hypothetical protein n=1 Tax=unclassified Gilliamella TaxID=2685620 RepID=UPI002269EAB9|nr:MULTISPECIES: hypothetical protein [unclassified Gilliamella]MCX8649966.1 hypothetical protein [Gilliamella sp. B2779]MCX8653898.1 hypothetical protein [Gilliamella sp. B2737]MCX8665948.1 hypothetical protein [Gilliamella sp. B2887]MCX8691739.1 hypothetical protein [Gilliamella sp. B2776]MCX8698272.1 hypothetical protein [Gilliamella sp. B3000]
MNNLYQCVENGYEKQYQNMMQNIENGDELDEEIDKRANELMQNFSNNNDQLIIDLISICLENNAVDQNIFNQFITDICYSQARAELNKK